MRDRNVKDRLHIGKPWKASKTNQKRLLSDGGILVHVTFPKASLRHFF